MRTNQPYLWLPWLASAFWLLAASVGHAQGVAESGQPRAGVGSSEAPGNSEAATGRTRAGSSERSARTASNLPYLLPDLFKRRLVSRFSVGQILENGVSDGFPDSNRTYTEASASFAYNLQRKHSEYVIDYTVSGRHYQRFRQLDMVAHDLGLSQVVQLGPRLNWVLDYRASFTPDASQTLLRESLAWERSLNEPLPADPMGPALSPGNPLPESRSAGEGLATVRSSRIWHSTSGTLTYALSPRADLSFQGAFYRQRYGNDDFFGSDFYEAGVGMSRRFTPRTSFAVNYRAGRFDQPGSFGRVMNHSLGFSLTRQLTPRSTLSLEYGPSWVSNSGQRGGIPLSTVLATLVGREALFRDTSQSFLTWMGGASLTTQWHKMYLRFSFRRSLWNLNVLNAAATSQQLAVELGRRLGEATSLGTSLFYQQNELIDIRETPQLDQKGLRVALTRRLTAGLDLSLFYDYSRLLTEAQGPVRLDYSRYGIHFVYHFPRMGGS